MTHNSDNPRLFIRGDDRLVLYVSSPSLRPEISMGMGAGVGGGSGQLTLHYLRSNSILLYRMGNDVRYFEPSISLLPAFQQEVVIH